MALACSGWGRTGLCAAGAVRSIIGRCRTRYGVAWRTTVAGWRTTGANLGAAGLRTGGFGGPGTTDFLTGGFGATLGVAFAAAGFGATLVAVAFLAVVLGAGVLWAVVFL